MGLLIIITAIVALEVSCTVCTIELNNSDGSTCDALVNSPFGTLLCKLPVPAYNHRPDQRHTFLGIMFVVGCLWGKYDISWEDYIKVNTSYSRQAVNVDFRHFRSRTDAFHNSLFVSFPRIWSTLPDDVSSEIVLNLFSFSRSLRRCMYIYHKLFLFLIVSVWFSETL